MVFRDRPIANIGPGDAHQGERRDSGVRYRLLQNLGSTTDAFIVQTDEGTPAFTFECTRRELKDVLVLRDLDRRVCCLLPATQSGPSAADILGSDGLPLAHVTRTPISAVRDRFEIDVLTGNPWIVTGDVGNREYALESPIGQVAEVSRRWFLRPDTFGVEVVPGQNDPLVLAVAATIDRLAHDFVH